MIETLAYYVICPLCPYIKNPQSSMLQASGLKKWRQDIHIKLKTRFDCDSRYYAM